MIYFVGIDPGYSGALALISDDLGEYYTEDCGPDIPSMNDNLVRLLSHAQRLGSRVSYGVVEKVSAMPKQGVSSMFKFGYNAGAWEMAVSMEDIPYELVTPQKWQKEMLQGVSGKDTKERSLTKARQLFPSAELHLKKHNGRSDALHLARYARKLYRGD